MDGVSIASRLLIFVNFRSSLCQLRQKIHSNWKFEKTPATGMFEGTTVCLFVLRQTIQIQTRPPATRSQLSVSKILILPFPPALMAVVLDEIYLIINLYTGAHCFILAQCLNLL